MTLYHLNWTCNCNLACRHILLWACLTYKDKGWTDSVHKVCLWNGWYGCRGWCVCSLATLCRQSETANRKRTCHPHTAHRVHISPRGLLLYRTRVETNIAAANVSSFLMIILQHLTYFCRDSLINSTVNAVNNKYFGWGLHFKIHYRRNYCLYYVFILLQSAFRNGKN